MTVIQLVTGYLSKHLHFKHLKQVSKYLDRILFISNKDTKRN